MPPENSNHIYQQKKTGTAACSGLFAIEIRTLLASLKNVMDILRRHLPESEKQPILTINKDTVTVIQQPHSEQGQLTFFMLHKGKGLIDKPSRYRSEFCAV